MNKHRFPLIFITLVLALALAVTSVAAAPRTGASVSLSTSQKSFSASQPVMVTVTLTNPTGSTLRLLKWFTPVSGLEEALFSVKRDGQAVGYTGAIYKRPPATSADYISLKAGESLTFKVNLGDYYDLSRSGLYEISYAVTSYNLYSEKGNGFKYQDTLTSVSIKVSVAGHASKGGKPTPPPDGYGNYYDRCTTTQQSEALTARTEATNYSSNALSYLNTGKSDARFTTWFGVFDPTRYSTVTTHFTKITEAFVTAGITYHCACKQPYYAYVYPNQPYNIYLCKYFWLAPMSGTDSKGGTLIHEMSHFYVVASTDDYVYGQSGAKSLAISDPSKAIMNADNHEYFAENTPPLP